MWGGQSWLRAGRLAGFFRPLEPKVGLKADSPAGLPAPRRGPQRSEHHANFCKQALAREAEKAKREIRCLLFGRRRHVYRILYEVADARQTVWVLHIRHGALKDLRPEELSHPGE